MFDDLVIANDGKFQENVLTCLYDNTVNTDLLHHMLTNINPINCPSSNVVTVKRAVSMLS